MVSIMEAPTENRETKMGVFSRRLFNQFRSMVLWFCGSQLCDFWRVFHVFFHMVESFVLYNEVKEK